MNKQLTDVLPASKIQISELEGPLEDEDPLEDEGPPSKRLCLDDDNTNPTTPSMNELQQELEKKNAQIESLKKKLKSTQQKSRRLKRKSLL